MSAASKITRPAPHEDGIALANFNEVIAAGRDDQHLEELRTSLRDIREMHDTLQKRESDLFMFRIQLSSWGFDLVRNCWPEGHVITEEQDLLWRRMVFLRDKVDDNYMFLEMNESEYKKDMFCLLTEPERINERYAEKEEFYNDFFESYFGQPPDNEDGNGQDNGGEENSHGEGAAEPGYNAGEGDRVSEEGQEEKQREMMET